MPVFHGTLFAVDRSEMMRYAGLPPKGAAIPDALIADALREAAALAEPRGAWELYPYDAEQGAVLGDPPLVLEGTAIRRHLARSVSAAVLAVTAGPAIEEASAAHFRAGRYTEGLLLDAAATAIAEHLADQLDGYIQSEARRTGRQTAWRYSPGYGDWPVTQQRALCALIGASRIGVSVTDHAMLVPRKSVTAVIGLSRCSEAPRPAHCALCHLASCPFRTKAERPSSEGGNHASL